jgi:hypothetical protein
MVHLTNSRRWIQFSLGSLVVIAPLVAALVGSVLYRARERDRAVGYFVSQGGYANVRQPNDAKGNPKPLPWSLRLARATAYSTISMPAALYRSRTPGPYHGFAGYLRAEALFPEARICVQADAQ